MAGLREIRVSRPEQDASISKRWFESDYFDLFLWSRAGQVFHLQLCYGKPMHERAVSWRDGYGYFHDGVLPGRGHGGAAWSALLEAGGRFDFAKVNARFLRESKGLDIATRKFVLAKLHHFALNGPSHPDKPPRIKVRHHGVAASGGAGTEPAPAPAPDSAPDPAPEPTL